MFSQWRKEVEVDEKIDEYSYFVPNYGSGENLNEMGVRADNTSF